MCKRSASKLDPSKTDKTTPYLIYDACPDNSSTPHLNDKCKGINKTELEDYVWVTDKETGHIYQNIHCARCQGVKTWITWRVRTTCHEVKTADFEHVTDILLNSKCDIINEVPDELNETIWKYRCYIPDRYSRCNVSGGWGQYDAETYAACETFDLPFYQIAPRGPVIYKNIFCYVCNRNSTRNPYIKCPKGEKGKLRTPFTRFSTLINFATSTDTQTDSRCEASEVFDKHLVSFNRNLITLP